MDRPVLTGDSRRDPAGVVFTSLFGVQRGDVQTPSALFLGKEGIALREVDREFLQLQPVQMGSSHPAELECCILEKRL